MLTEGVCDEIKRAIRQEGVREVCGFLIADAYGTHQFWRIPNQSCHALSFAMPAREVSRVFRHARKTGLKVIALLHSHPNGTTPSRDDRRAMRYSDLPWIIVHLDGDQLVWKTFDCRRTDQTRTRNCDVSV